MAASATFLNLFQNEFLIFLLVLTRISALVMTAPIIGPRSVPIKIRVLLAGGISLLLAPAYAHTTMLEPNSLVDLILLLIPEALWGVSIGLAIMILFAGFHVTGQIAGQMSGLQLADVFDPGFDSNVPILARLLDLVALAVFVTTSGHRRVIAALLDSFQAMPPGNAHFSESLVTALVNVTARSFEIGIRVAAPVMIALLLSVLIMGLISRTLPQLNIIAVGFSFNTMVMLSMMLVSISALSWILEIDTQLALEQIQTAIQQAISKT